MTRIKKMAVVAAQGFIFAACGSDTDDTTAGATIDVTVSGLEALAPGSGVYEGWLIYGTEKVSTGTFNDVATISMSTARDPAKADKFVITIEPTTDPDPGPSGIVVLAGNISADGKTATLTFEADLSTTAGTFILKTPTDDATNVTRSIQLTMTGLDTLTSGIYEGWLIFGTDKISTGTFTDGAGATMTTDRNPMDADQFVVTIEPTPDNDPAPSGVVALAGTITGTATVNLAFGASFDTAAGGFILKTPTDDMTNANNDEAGVWFVSMPGPTAALTLPALPMGWVYEGWGVTQGVPLSTGRFTDVSAADLASPHSNGGPPFPGEDFLTDLPAGITPPVNLADGASKIVISVEPDMAGVDPTGDGPFALKPLAIDVPMNLAGGTNTALAPGPVTSISGSVTFSTTPVDNDAAGVWFVMMPGPEAGLTLPTLPSGWVYEGWAVTQGVPLSTGRFATAAGADLASPYSTGGPPFPGEDLLTNLPASITAPVNLADGASKIVVSVEPDIAGVDPTGDGPFALKPLALDVPMNLAGGTNTNLGPGPVVTVRGTAKFTAK